jgi:hypothetical protein
MRNACRTRDAGQPAWHAQLNYVQLYRVSNRETHGCVFPSVVSIFPRAADIAASDRNRTSIGRPYRGRCACTAHTHGKRLAHRRRAHAHASCLCNSHRRQVLVGRGNKQRVIPHHRRQNNLRLTLQRKKTYTHMSRSVSDLCLCEREVASDAVPRAGAERQERKCVLAGATHTVREPEKRHVAGRGSCSHEKRTYTRTRAHTRISAAHTRNYTLDDANATNTNTNTNTKYTYDTGQTRNKLLMEWVHLSHHAAGHANIREHRTKSHSQHDCNLTHKHTHPCGRAFSPVRVERERVIPVRRARVQPLDAHDDRRAPREHVPARAELLHDIARYDGRGRVQPQCLVDDAVEKGELLASDVVEAGHAGCWAVRCDLGSQPA